MTTYDLVIRPDGTLAIVAVSPESGNASEVEMFPRSSLRAALRRLDELQEKELVEELRMIRDSLNRAVLDPAGLLKRAIEKAGLKVFLNTTTNSPE